MDENSGRTFIYTIKLKAERRKIHTNKREREREKDRRICMDVYMNDTICLLCARYLRYIA